MSDTKKIQTALISVYHKDNLDRIIKQLHRLGVKLISTGGTKAFIEQQGVKAIAVEDLTGYPSIFDGRVKTLHPKIFGGILSRRAHETDQQEMQRYDIRGIDLVIVDLYPFEATVASGASEADIIEKIDIGGISLIRAAAKNFDDVLIVSSREQYADLITLFEQKQGETSLADRKQFAAKAFAVTSYYDTAIANYFAAGETFKFTAAPAKSLRYGENPHQKGTFYGNFEAMFDQLHGKEISYNNLLDIDAAVALIDDFDTTAFAILKHNNACGIAADNSLLEAWNKALAADPVSAFGGVFVTNTTVDASTAAEMDKIFFEVTIAPSYSTEALTILKQKKNRIILVRKPTQLTSQILRTALNGILVQDKDTKVETQADMRTATNRTPTATEVADLLFANKVVKHTKSNAIVLAKNNQLLASGLGQTSRVDALKQAIEKAKSFGFDLHGAVMASDAFFPFPDCVQIANEVGITAVIQPGGSVRDQETVDFCNQHNIAMVMTGYRHFKH